MLDLLCIVLGHQKVTDAEHQELNGVLGLSSLSTDTK